MKKLAFLSATIKRPEEDQPCFVVVGVPDGGKVWESAILCKSVEEAEKYLVLKTSSENFLKDSSFQKLFPFSRSVRPIPSKDITIQQNLTKGFCSVKKQYELLAKPEDSDYSNTGSSLEKYIEDCYSVSKFWKEEDAGVTPRKLLFSKDNVDWDKFWNSPEITEKEKEVCAMPIDLDICASNAKRVCYKRFAKEMTTNYAVKKFTDIGLHGDPGGGKTQMVINYCGLNHIPLVIIPCDPMMSINQVLAQVGPATRGSVVKEQDISKAIEGMKNMLTVLQQQDNPDEKTQEKIRLLVGALKDAATISKDTADLVKTPSILMKCLKNNLPLVVFFDEANIASTQFQNSLSPIISDGVFRDGPVTGRNKNTIKWILAWNPRTSGTKTFDGKFFDRMSFIHVGNVPISAKEEFDAAKILHSMHGSAPKYGSADQMINKCADLSKEQKNEILDILHKQNATPEGLEWYAKYLVSKATKKEIPEFKENTFVSAYLGDAPIAGDASIVSASKVLSRVITKASDQMRTLTKGKDLKNPDKDSCYYISDRNYDIVRDLIFSFSSVEKGLSTYMYDLLTSAIFRGDSEERDMSDKTAKSIVNSILSTLSKDIDAAQTELFCDVPEDHAKTTSEVLERKYVPDAWKNEEVKEEKKEEEFPPNSTAQTHCSASEFTDEEKTTITEVIESLDLNNYSFNF